MDRQVAADTDSQPDQLQQLEDQLRHKDEHISVLQKKLDHFRAWLQSLQTQVQAKDPQILKNARRLYIGGIPEGTKEVRRAASAPSCFEQSNQSRQQQQQHGRAPSLAAVSALTASAAACSTCFSSATVVARTVCALASMVGVKGSKYTAANTIPAWAAAEPVGVRQHSVYPAAKQKMLQCQNSSRPQKVLALPAVSCSVGT